MNCHGISGNTFSMYYAYQQTANVTYLYRALQFQSLVVATPMLSAPGTMRDPDPIDLNWDLWVGTYESAVMLWGEMLYGTSETVSMTGYMLGL